MGLRDRQYMRDAYNPPYVTKWLIWTLIGAFVVQSVALFYWDFDAIKHLGFEYATRSGITIAIGDIKVPERKAEMPALARHR